MAEFSQSVPFGDNVPEFSVEEISNQVKRTIESTFNRIRVRGEASGVSMPRSGHIYLKLVQERHQLDAVIWRSKVAVLSIKPTDGVEYVATGKLTSYSGKSSYQLIIDGIEEAGEGALLARLERLKAKLQAEGLFESVHKQPLPLLPNVIGVITSPGGAVIRDILHVLHDRFPRHVVLWPAAVQGPECPSSVAHAIRGFNAIKSGDEVPRPDILIVARGGGSVEDLAGFSEEIVVRAAFESEIPLISAVGHETDTPLIDLAADVRAPTPSVAAEKSVPSRTEMVSRVSSLGGRLAGSLTTKADRNRQRLRDIARGLPRQDNLFALPSQRLDHASQRIVSSIRGKRQDHEIKLSRIIASLQRPKIINESETRLSVAAAKLSPKLIAGLIKEDSVRLAQAVDAIKTSGHEIVRTKRQRLAELDRLLQSLSYNMVLKRGYAVVKGATGVVESSELAKMEPVLDIEFHDGNIKVETQQVT